MEPGKETRFVVWFRLQNRRNTNEYLSRGKEGGIGCSLCMATRCENLSIISPPPFIHLCSQTWPKWFKSGKQDEKCTNSTLKSISLQEHNIWHGRTNEKWRQPQVCVFSNNDSSKGEIQPGIADMQAKMELNFKYFEIYINCGCWHSTILNKRWDWSFCVRIRDNNSYRSLFTFGGQHLPSIHHSSHLLSIHIRYS